jgi:hypothetical protein
MQCPSCGSACITVSAEQEEKRIDDFERGRYRWCDYNLNDPEPPGWMPRPHHGYSAMLGWGRLQSHCFRHVVHLKNAFKKHTGTEVDLTL